MADEPDVDQDFLDATERQARVVLQADGVQATYDAGIDFMSVCMRGMEQITPDGFLPPAPAALYQVWGALTDEMDAPGRGSPEQDASALRRMHRAAAEWLEVSRLNKERRGYLDRWVYEECGYDRPSGRLT